MVITSLAGTISIGRVRLRIASRQFPSNHVWLADQQYAHSVLFRRQHTPLHLRPGCVVSPHGINGDCDHGISSGAPERTSLEASAAKLAVRKHGLWRATACQNPVHLLRVLYRPCPCNDPQCGQMPGAAASFRGNWDTWRALDPFRWSCARRVLVRRLECRRFGFGIALLLVLASLVATHAADSE